MSKELKTLKELDKMSKPKILAYLHSFGVGTKIDLNKTVRQSLLDLCLQEKLIAPIPSIDTETGNVKSKFDLDVPSPEETLNKVFDNFSKIKKPSIDDLLKLIQSIPTSYQTLIFDSLRDGKTPKEVRSMLTALNSQNMAMAEKFSKYWLNFTTKAFEIFQAELLPVFADWFETFCSVDKDGNQSKTTSQFAMYAPLAGCRDIKASMNCLKVWVQVRAAKVRTPDSLKAEQILKGHATRRTEESDSPGRHIAQAPSNVKAGDLKATAVA